MPRYIVHDKYVPCYVTFKYAVEADNEDDAYDVFLDGDSRECLGHELQGHIHWVGDGETEVIGRADSGPAYVAVWNLPGCLPEMEPATFDNFTEARDFIAEHLDGLADDEASKHGGQVTGAWTDLIEQVTRQTDTFSLAAPDGYVYSVSIAED